MNKRWLIVDDEPINLLIVKKILEQKGQLVASVNSGKEALEKLKNESFDILLVDHNMPLMDGYETTQKVRTMKGCSQYELRIIGVTADDTESVLANALKAGMDDVLTKPINVDIIDSIINNGKKE